MITTNPPTGPYRHDAPFAEAPRLAVVLPVDCTTMWIDPRWPGVGEWVDYQVASAALGNAS